MSRIQEILAKADRDGTAGLVHPTIGLGGGSVATASLAAAMPPVAPAMPSVPFAIPAATEPRTVQPRLHRALIAAIAPHSNVAEQYRAIRGKLSHREESGGLRTLAVTSPARGDGKSVTAANLALTMAQELQRSVVLVDADLRYASLHTLFAIDRQPGLGDVLTGDASLDEALVYVPELRLMLLPAGRVPDYPTEMLGSAAMRDTLDSLSTRFDRIVLDLPAALPLADVGTVTPLVDGVVMVVRAGVTQRPVLDQALATFEQSKVVGMVLNDTE